MHAFDQDIQLTRLDTDIFTGKISSNWLIHSTSNGGYLMAIVTNAMLHCTEKKATPVITVNYLSRCIPGDVTLSVKKYSESAGFDRLHVRMSQNGEDKVHATGLFSVQREEYSLVRYETKAPEIHPREQSIPIPNISDYTIYDNIDVRLDPECSGWITGKSLSEKSELKGWIAFKEPRAFDLTAITLAADAFPPPILASQGMIAWVPTLEFSVNIRNIPQTQWLKCIFRTRFINCGLLEEDGEIWDEKNELVAISRQIAQFRPMK